MRVRCPKCEESFNAKINARRIKCPACGFREDAPEGGFGEAFASGKRRPGGFQPEQSAGGASQSTPVAWIAVGAVVLVLLAGAAAWFVFGQGSAPPPTEGNPKVAIRTSMGEMVAELYPGQAPKTVENFLRYVDEGYYTDLQFYRIIPGFVNQGGGDSLGKPGSHPPITNEAAASGLKNVKYTLAMARKGPACEGCPDQPDSATSEFFINAVDNCSLDPKAASSCPEQAVSEAGYAVFGKLVSGLEVSDVINGMAGQDPPTFSIRRADAAAPPPASTPPSSTTSGPPQVCQDLPVGPPAPHEEVAADLITPGFWNVCGDREHMYLWVHNNSTTARPYTWNITGIGGSPLPPGWSITFQSPSGILQPVGTKGSGPGGRPTYPDWASTLATLTLPADTGPTHFPAELRVGGAVRPFIFHIQAPRGTVTHPGDQVTTCYDLKGEDGRDIQKGPFPLQVAGQGAVPGYSYGTAGVAMGETVVLVVPPPFAYPEGNPPDIKAWETLRWSAKIVSDPATCPR
jgi:cyclophilin family peptidyl-prolyl cis-trans isomerase